MRWNEHFKLDEKPDTRTTFVIFNRMKYIIYYYTHASRN